MGYHIAKITKAPYGTIEKIFEECEELADANNQDKTILILCELSDIIGAIEGYLEKQFENHIILDDLIEMAHLTKSAFQDGTRK